MSKTIIYCLDCETDFTKSLEKYSFDIISGSLGYKSGVTRLTEAPNECDFFVFNLTKPGFFDMKDWGPDGGNDNFRCKLVDKVDKSMYIHSGGLGGARRYPRFQLIQESQMHRSGSTFDYEDLQKAISEGGIDCIYYLNPIFMFHSLYDTPDWIGFRFSTDLTKAKRWNMDENALKICDSLRIIGSGDLELCSPIEFKLLDLILSTKGDLTKIKRMNLIINNVNECFAAIVQFGKGFIYFIPSFSSPAEGTVSLIRDILPNFKQAHATFLQTSMKIHQASLKQRQEKGERIYAPGEQYAFYKDLKEIVSGAAREVFIVDAYANEEIFDLYVDKIKTGVTIRFLTKDPSKNLATVVNKFKARPDVKIETKEDSKIHDRVIFVDEKQCWVLGQSIKDAAVKAPTYLLPIDSVVDMRNLYEEIWNKATVF